MSDPSGKMIVFSTVNIRFLEFEIVSLRFFLPILCRSLHLNHKSVRMSICSSIETFPVF